MDDAYVGVYVGANRATGIARRAVVAAIVAILICEEGNVDGRGSCRETEEDEGLHFCWKYDVFDLNCQERYS